MKRLIKTSWEGVREQVGQSSPRLVEIIDALSPDKSFPIYLVSYPYGTVIGDEKKLYYPIDDTGAMGTIKDLPSEVVADLAYAGNSIPMGMVLNNSTETYIEDFGICMPVKMFQPGTFFGLLRELEKNGTFHPSGLLKMHSGARSLFVVPNIGDTGRYTNFHRDYGIKATAPPTLYDQYTVFKELYQNTPTNEWSSTLLYFSHKWVDKMQSDERWKGLKLYLLEGEWRNNLYKINESYFELIFSLTQAKKNLKPNPYITDTARYLLSVAVGSSPGFLPACDESAAPIKLFQQALLQGYGLKYAPTFMHPGYMHALSETLHNNIYYSLQYPITMVFSPKSRKESSVIEELRELKHIMTKFMDDLINETSVCKNTIAYNMLKNIDIEYFHSKEDAYGETVLASTMPEHDKLLCRNMVNDNIMPFADSGTFVRGCVRISKK